jgi:uncharacterized protein
MATELSLAAAFVAGVSGSLHCLAMCGGISGALGMRARAQGHSAPGALLHALLYQGGRLFSYSLAGALCGAVGALLLRVLNVVLMAMWLRVLAGIVMMLLGLQLLFGWRLLAPIEQLGYRLWRAVSPLAQRTQLNNGWLQSLALGALWGWLPCGLVYSMLLLGVLGGTALQGAEVMLVFGLGTLPMMLGSSLMASQLARGAAQHWRRLGGITLLVLGGWTSYIAMHPGH